MLGKHLTADMCCQGEQAAHPEGWNRSFFWLIPWLQAGKEGPFTPLYNLFLFLFSPRSPAQVLLWGVMWP